MATPLRRELYSAATARQAEGDRCQPYATPERFPSFPDRAERNFLQARVELPLLAALLPLGGRRRVLEIGCGRGVALIDLAARLAPERLVGVDIELELLDVASARLAACGVTAELRLADARALPFPDRSFDLVVDFGTCWHMAGSRRALAEVRRVLAPGGIFVHETWMAQLLSHPLRLRALDLPWPRGLEADRSALLWASRVRRG
jgi:SAM-dependent methyltransferase